MSRTINGLFEQRGDLLFKLLIANSRNDAEELRSLIEQMRGVSNEINDELSYVQKSLSKTEWRR